MTVSVAEFMSSAPAAPLTGNTSWASRYAAEHRRLWREWAERLPRNVQRRLGPSELGVECDRQVVGKLAGIPRTNHVVDPWASTVGTSLHSTASDHVYPWANETYGPRWLTEQRVKPVPEHPGTADLYDGRERAVVDHKFLGPTSLAKIKRPEGPPVKYQVQLLFYGRGYINLGFPVDRVVVLAYPRTAASLAGLYAWERPMDAAADAQISQVLQRTAFRKVLAAGVAAGRIRIEDVPRTPQDDECFFCPQYRPEAKDGGQGCPGTVAPKITND